MLTKSVLTQHPSFWVILSAFLLSASLMKAQEYPLSEQYQTIRISIGGFEDPDQPHLDKQLYIFEIELHLRDQLIRYRKRDSKTFSVLQDTLDYSYFLQERLYRRLDQVLVLNHLDKQQTRLCQFKQHGRYYRVELRGGTEGSGFTLRAYEFREPRECLFPSDSRLFRELIDEYFRLADQVFPSFSNYMKRS